MQLTMATYSLKYVAAKLCRACNARFLEGAKFYEDPETTFPPCQRTDSQYQPFTQTISKLFTIVTKAIFVEVMIVVDVQRRMTKGRLGPHGS